MSVTVYTAPEFISHNSGAIKIFLAGTIDDGESEDWQSLFIQAAQNVDSPIQYDIYNPRRPDWTKNMGNLGDVKVVFTDPLLYQQANWEADAMDRADIIFMYFAANSKSPITLHELGLYAFSDKLRVVCYPDFYRRGNVEVTCSRNRIPLTISSDPAWSFAPKIIL